MMCLVELVTWVTKYVVGFSGYLEECFKGGNPLVLSTLSFDPYNTVPINSPCFGDEETEAQVICP